MAGEKFLRGQSSSAFALQFQNPQRIFSARDDNSIFVCRQDRADVAIISDNFCLPDFQQLRLRFGVQ
jgi:hypothetical protein